MAESASGQLLANIAATKSECPVPLLQARQAGNSSPFGLCLPAKAFTGGICSIVVATFAPAQYMQGGPPASIDACVSCLFLDCPIRLVYSACLVRLTVHTRILDIGWTHAATRT